MAWKIRLRMGLAAAGLLWLAPFRANADPATPTQAPSPTTPAAPAQAPAAPAPAASPGGSANAQTAPGSAPQVDPYLADIHVDRGPFDARRSYDGLALDFGLFSARPPGGDFTGGWEVRMGQDITAVPPGFYLDARTYTVFRSFDSKSFAFSVPQPDVVAGVRVGPVEIGAGAALSLVNVDVFHAKWNVSLLSPRAEAEAAIRLGVLRIGARAYGEFYWRWFGEDRLIHGVDFGISLQRMPLVRR